MEKVFAAGCVMLFLMAMRLGGAVLKWGYNQKDLKLMIPIICQIRPID